MLEEKKFFILTLAFLTALLSSAPDVVAQGSTVGDAAGTVKHCSMTDVNGRKVPVETPQKSVTVCAFWEDSWKKKKNVKCPKDCVEPDCEYVETDSQGWFLISALPVGSWVFVAAKENLKLKDLFVITAIIGTGKTASVEPRNPPPPLWLQPTDCPTKIAQSSNAEPNNQEHIAASVQESRRAETEIRLASYGDNNSTSYEFQTAVQSGVILKGQVVDAERRPLKDAEVFISALGEDDDDELSEFPEPVETEKDGKFTLTLPATWKPGTYIFSVTRSGYRPSIMTLEEAVKILSAKPSSSQGSATEEVNYVVLARKEDLHSRSEGLVEKFEATRRHVFLPEVMQTMPLSGTRSFDEFALLAPGVLPPPETFGKVGPGVSATIGTAGQFSVNGLRSRENNFAIDGSDNNDEDIGTRRQGFIMTVPQPVESVQELHVITALGDTRFGRNIGGQINVLTKTGTGGGFHGTFYTYIADNRLNARDPFDQSGSAVGFPLHRASDNAPVLFDGAPLIRQSQVGGEDQFTRLQIGLAVGGRLTRDKDTSYFVSAERQDVRGDREAHFAVPTVKQRGAFDSGDTGLLLVDGKNVKTPLYPASVPGNAIFSLFPFPNNPLGPYGENTYSNVLPADGHGWRFSVKLGRDFKGDPPDGEWWRSLFTAKVHIDQITGRYNFTDEFSTVPVTGGALFSSMRPKVRTQNLAGFVNRSLSSSTSGILRISFGRTRLSFGERLDATMLPSSALANTPFLLNAPLVLNVTKPNADGTLNTPTFVSAAGPAGSALLSSLGYQGVTQTEQITGPLGQVFVAGFSPIGVDVENFPQVRANNTYQIADTVTSVRNAHIFTFGADFRKTRINSTLDRNFRPRATFHSLASGPFADIIERPGAGQVQAGQLTGLTLAAAGVPTGFLQSLSTVPDSSVGLRYTQVNIFFQDKWRVHPRFYLTAGLRYEVNTAPDTVGRRLETAFDPREIRILAEDAARFCQPNLRCNDLVGSLTAAFPADFRFSFIADRNDFDPRVGFAWTLPGLENTVIRAGFGAYSGQSPGIVLNQVRNAFPAFLPLNLANFTPRSGDRTYLFNLANPAVQQLLPSPGGVPAGITPGTLNQISTSNTVAFLVNQGFNLQNLSLAPTVFGLDLILPQRELKTPYAYHYALTVERQFRSDYMISAAYVGTRGNSLLRLATPDLGLNNTRFAGDIVTAPLNTNEPFPYFQGQIVPPQNNLISQSFAIARTFFESSAKSAYHSLQLDFRKRYSKSLLIGSAFTYSHSIDDASDFFDNAGSFSLPQNSVFRSERGPSNFDIRIRSATHFVLDLQREWFGKKEWAETNKDWWARVLGGLQLAGIFTAQGGQPYTVNSAFDINRDGNLTDRLNTIDGLVRESTDDRVRLRIMPGVNTRDLLAPDGLDGSVGRNTFRASHLYNIDFSVTHRIPLGDHNRFLVRVEFLNMFNWANYGIPVRILESPGFGTAIGTLNPPRTIHLVGKFQF